jgi:hypothetical protein
MRWRGWRRKRPQFDTRYRVTLGPHHTPREDRVVHVYVGPDGEEEAPLAYSARIDVASDATALLVYLDTDGDWVADSLCESVDEAMHLAERDYRVRSDEWNEV